MKVRLHLYYFSKIQRAHTYFPIVNNPGIFYPELPALMIGSGQPNISIHLLGTYGPRLPDHEARLKY